MNIVSGMRVAEVRMQNGTLRRVVRTYERNGWFVAESVRRPGVYCVLHAATGGTVTRPQDCFRGLMEHDRALNLCRVLGDQAPQDDCAWAADIGGISFDDLVALAKRNMDWPLIGRVISDWLATQTGPLDEPATLEAKCL